MTPPDIVVDLQYLNDVTRSTQDMVKRIKSSLQTGDLHKWQAAVTETTNWNTLIGADVAGFGEALTLSGAYQGAFGIFFQEDLAKYLDAITVLGEGAAAIAAIFSSAATADAVSAQSVDDALNSAPVPSAILYT